MKRLFVIAIFSILTGGCKRTDRVGEVNVETHILIEALLEECETLVRLGDIDKLRNLERSDPRGTPLKFFFASGAKEKIIVVQSAGADCEHDSVDDITGVRILPQKKSAEQDVTPNR